MTSSVRLHVGPSLGGHVKPCRRAILSSLPNTPAASTAAIGIQRSIAGRIFMALRAMSFLWMTPAARQVVGGLPKGSVGVHKVLRARHPFKILGSIIRFVPVFVVHLNLWLTWKSQECHCYETGNLPFLMGVSAEKDMLVSSPLSSRLQDSSRPCALSLRISTNPPPIRCAVERGISRYWKPQFITHGFIVSPPRCYG